MIAILSVIAVAMVLVIVAGVVRMVWRTLHDNEEMVPGGSWGDQMLTAGKGKGASRWRRKRAG